MSDRTLSAGVQAEIDGPLVRPVLLVFLDFPSDPVYLSTAHKTITFDSNDYLALGKFISFSAFPETADSGTQGIEIVLSGFDSDLLSDVLTTSYRGSDCAVHLAFLDASDAVISDPITLYRGQLDKGTIQDNAEQSVIRLNIESRLLDQLRPRQFRYTDADQQSLNAGQGDTGLKDIPKIQNLHVEWGGSK